MGFFEFKSNRDKVDAAVDEAINMALEMVGQCWRGEYGKHEKARITKA